MKHYQLISRMTMALVIAFGVQTTASAQFGGLLKKAKKAVKEKVEEVVAPASTTTTTPTESTTQAATETPAATSQAASTPAAATADGGIKIINIEHGKLLGTYYPDQHKFVNGGGTVYLIADDGTVTFADDGTEAGKIADNGFSSRGIKWMEYNAGAKQYQLDGVKVGEVFDDQGVSVVTLYGKEWLQTTKPIDNKILAYLAYGTSFNSEILKDMYAQKAKQQQAAQARAQSSDSSSGSSASASSNTKLKQGDRWELRNKEQIFLNGSFVATVKSDGRICDRTGYPLGELKSDGAFKSTRYHNGYVSSSGDIKNNIGYPIGRMKSDGSLWENNGPCIGNISSGFNRYIAAYAFFIYDGR